MHSQVEALPKDLPLDVDAAAVEAMTDERGSGNVLTLNYEHVTTVATELGQHGITAEHVAADVAAEARKYVAARVPVGSHLADQLLIPLAMAGGAFRTFEPRRHTQTNLRVVNAFLEARLAAEENDSGLWTSAAIHRKTTRTVGRRLCRPHPRTARSSAA